MNAETAETIDEIMKSNIAARFDISDEEAERIAAKAVDGADWLRIWENDDWWTDENTA